MINIKRILKLIDLANPDDCRMADCLSLASKFDAEMHLLHVVPVSGIPLFGSHQRLAQSTEELETLPLPSQNVRVTREVREGTLGSSLIAYASEHNIDLILIDQADLRGLDQRGTSALISEVREQLPIPILLTDSTNWLKQFSIDSAIAALREELGPGLEGSHDETRLAIRETVEAKLRLSADQAEAILVKMQESQVLTWNEVASGDAVGGSSGYWTINQPDSLASEVFTLVADEFDLERTAAISLIQRAIEVNATDIHIDPDGTSGYTVQFRIDGRVHVFCRMQPNIAGITMKQIKLMANISLADPFHPSESRLEMPGSIRDHEVRVTTAPVADGEAIAMRIIDGRKLSLPVSEIGLSAQSSVAVNRMLHERSGLVLIAGPTGAGKTTTAYSILRTLNSLQQKIISVEDPVELVVSFMRQLNVDEKHGFTMRTALSTILRMDPDAVFIGEIRNVEAAQIAMQAASCGKRTISTIHLKDVSSTVAAMRDFGIDGRTLADGLAGVIAQRLVRRVCQACCERRPPTHEEIKLFESQELTPPAEISHARGCPECRGSGYRGRVGLFEAVVIEDELIEAIRQELHVSELRQLVRKSGASLFLDGLHKVCAGLTTMEELQEASALEETHPGLALADPNEQLGWRSS